MKGETEPSHRKLPSPSFSKTAREWILSSALYDGIEDEDIRQIEMLLAERGANPNTLLPEYGIAPFHMVVANDSTRFAVQATDICLQHGADPNVRSEDGLTPVHLAAMWGCPEVLQVLLASGGDPWLVDCLNMNAFDYALKEDQEECYKLLTTCCNSQPKPSSHSKSPYQMNLKRVVLYKNDLQIVYEASPTGSQKCVSTQTSPTLTKDGPEWSNSKKFVDKTIYSKTTQEDIKINERNKFCKVSNTATDKCTNTLKNSGARYSVDSCSSYDESILSSRLKEVIINHRRNSTTFEYSPPSPKEIDESEDRAVLRRGSVVGRRSEMSNLASELIKKLNNTNKLRQSLKHNGNQNNVLKNITQRKKPVIGPTSSINEKEFVSTKESSHNSLSQNETFIVHDSPSKGEQFSPKSFHRNNIGFVVNGSSVDESSQRVLPENEIGFVLNDSVASSTILTRRNQTASESNVVSPHSIGFILDNLEGTVAQTRGSSLFSDIDSDVKSPVRNRNENVYTEDESATENIQKKSYSPSETLDPYVSCIAEDTREGSSKEEHFHSCFDTPPNTGESLLIKSDGTKSITTISEGNSILDIDSEKKTPVNPKLTTSTPERLSAGGTVFHFPAENGVRPEQRKGAWVEAVVSSSSDDDQYMSISEEYEYADLDEGVVLIERRYLKDDVNVSECRKKKEKPAVASSTSELSEVSTISGSEGAYDTDELRQALKAHGFSPGPINGSTKRVYLRKLKRFRRKPEPLPAVGQPAYSPELLGTLNMSCEHKLLEWAHLEDSMSSSFTSCRRPWREGQTKTSFTYLLLDPRVAHCLPTRATREPHPQLWADFLRAVFYVGKGKRSRPYTHLYSAVSYWREQRSTNSKKIQKILDIWTSGQGVICLHVFLNIIPVEAYTREAAMISALTLASLTNEKVGEFYGSAACWSTRLKRRLGCFLLHRAFKVFLAEGERQLRPADID